VRESLPFHSQACQARQPRQLRGHGAREVVAAQVPAKPTCQVSTHHRSTRHAGWSVVGSVQSCQARHQPELRGHGAREVVVVQPPAKPTFQVSTHHRSTRHAGWRVAGSVQFHHARHQPELRGNGTREVVSVQVHVPAKKKPTCQVSTHHRSTRHAGWSVVGSVQFRQARHQPELRGHGAREVVVVQPPAKPTFQVSTHHRSTRHAGWRVAGSAQVCQARHHPHVRRDGAREVVVAQPPATPPARSVSTIVQRDTQGGGRNEAYRLLRLVNIPTVVGMVPVRSLLHRFLQNPPARSVSTIVQRDMQDGVW
jgi:hypothetical protein